jgi:hypothetical protein
VDVRRKYAAVLAGRHNDVGLEPPMLDDIEIRGLVESLLERTKRPPLGNPIHHVVRDGLRPVDRHLQGTGHEATNGVTVWFRWTADARELGRRVKHGHAHALLLCQDHNETDAILVTAELALPSCLLKLYADADAAARDAIHAPGWLVAAQFERRRDEVERFFLVS